MRKLVVYLLMSLDGDVERPSRYFTPAEVSGQPPEFDSVMEQNEIDIIGSQDAVLLGRRMYEEWSAYWPDVRDNPFAGFINNVRKYVVTSRPLSATWNNSEVLEQPIEEAVRRIKAQPGGDIGVHGSIQLAQSLLSAGLVDELQLVVGPAFGFPGRKLFADGAQVQRLELLSARPTPSGSVLLGYRVPAGS